MIISASGRTDIPALYSEWFMNRIRAGYCVVPDPFDNDRFTYVPLNPEAVEVIVFWTRYPLPLMPHLKELTERGYNYYFHYTAMHNPNTMDPTSPSLDTSVKVFRDLAENIGQEKIFWRYDPILFSTVTPVEFHHKTYRSISTALSGYTMRSIISIVDLYDTNILELKKHEIDVIDCDQRLFDNLMYDLVCIAEKNGMEITSCAEELSRYGIQPGKCIDDSYIEKTFGIKVTGKKDPFQRKACGCIASRDIGMYNSCVFGCRYCYATTDHELARMNHRYHDSNSPSLVGWHDCRSE